MRFYSEQELCNLVYNFHMSCRQISRTEKGESTAWLMARASSKGIAKLDGCIVWNKHNTVFASKRSAISSQAVYFLHSTRPSVT